MHAFCKNMRSPRLLQRLVKERKFSFTKWCGLSGRSAPNPGGTEMMSLQPNMLAEASRSLLLSAYGKARSTVQGSPLSRGNRERCLGFVSSGFGNELQ